MWFSFYRYCISIVEGSLRTKKKFIASDCFSVIFVHKTNKELKPEHISGLVTAPESLQFGDEAAGSSEEACKWTLRLICDTKNKMS